MFNTDTKQTGGGSKTDLATLRNENKLLREKYEEISHQMDSVAKANVNAFKSISEIEDVNKNLKAEIEKRTQVEKELRESNSKMEKQLEKLTAEMTNKIAAHKKDKENLERLNKELETTPAASCEARAGAEAATGKMDAANRELAEFAYTMAYKLKTPMRAVGNLAGMISADYYDKLDEEGRQHLDILMDKTRGMCELVDDIQRYSEIGRVFHEKEQADTNEVVQEAIEAIAPSANIQITIENKLPVITCETTRIVQIFQNLLDNAVKYMDKPKAKIRIGCVQDDGFWKFHVADNGPGIEEKSIEEIFNIFQTRTKGNAVESNGIGLPSARKIVEMCGGKIWVESKAGEGATFFFTLPKQETGVSK